MSTEIDRHFIWADRFCAELNKLELSPRARRALHRSVLWKTDDAFYHDGHLMSFHEWALAVRDNPKRLRKTRNIGKGLSSEISMAVDKYLASSKSSTEYAYA